MKVHIPNLVFYDLVFHALLWAERSVKRSAHGSYIQLYKSILNAKIVNFYISFQNFLMIDIFLKRNGSLDRLYTQ